MNFSTSSSSGGAGATSPRPPPSPFSIDSSASTTSTRSHRQQQRAHANSSSASSISSILSNSVRQHLSSSPPPDYYYFTPEASSPSFSASSASSYFYKAPLLPSESPSLLGVSAFPNFGRTSKFTAWARQCLTIPITIWSYITWCIPKRFLRLAILGLILLLALIIHLSLSIRPAHRPFFAPPLHDPIVHGIHVSEAPGSLYPLEPFPYSPMQRPSGDEVDDEDLALIYDRMPNGQPLPWLAAVMTHAADTERRMLIRSTWMQLYNDIPFDGRFVVSNPGPRWAEIVSMENKTFGDMIVLDHIQEDAMTSHTIKTIESWKWLVRQNKHYEFVSKIDSDLFLNARAFWDRFLSPKLSNDTGRLVRNVDRHIIGELYYSPVHDLVYPHGSMYTVSWDLVELLVGLQEQHNVVAGEDMTLAMLMLKGKETANVVNFMGSEKFDYDDADSRGDGTAWVREKTHPDAAAHALYGSDIIAVHQLKEKELWFKVADCFDERGIKKTAPPSGLEKKPSFSLRWHDFWHTMGLSSRYRSRFDAIPDYFWSFKNGSWMCDGIWNMGRTKTGFLDA